MTQKDCGLRIVSPRSRSRTCDSVAAASSIGCANRWSSSGFSGGGDVLLAIDHLDTLLERLAGDDAEQLLAVIRAERQRKDAAQMLLVGRTGGTLARSLGDDRRAMYHSGDVLAMRRAYPKRFVDDLALGSPWVEEPGALIGTAAELANGCPAYVWRIVDRAGPIVGEPRERALTAWRALREESSTQTGQLFEVLASAQRAAPAVVCAISSGLAPYGLPINDRSVNAALNRLRARGVLFVPEPRKWAVSDPLLAGWARDHCPSWIRRRTGAIASRES